MKTCRTHRAVNWFLVLGCAASLAAAGAAGAIEIRQLTPTGNRLTPFDPWISGDGSVAVYGAGANVFLATTDGTTHRQLTEAVGGECFEPKANADGQRIVMTCSANVTGSNPDGNPEIVLLEGSTFIAITNSGPPAENGEPAINGDGRAIAFLSTANYVGQNADGSREVFLWRQDPPLLQVTSGTDDYDFVVLNGDGDRVIFGKTLENDGAAVEQEQAAFLYNVQTGQTGQLLAGVPILNGATSRDLHRVLFETTADLGGDPQSTLKLYVMFIGQNPRLLYEIPAGCRSEDLTANIDASRMVATFGSCAPARLFTAGRTETLAIPSDAGDIQLDARGRRLLFVSSEDLTSDNPQHTPQLFVADFVTGCGGDCGGNGAVTVDELVSLVNIALGTALLDSCPSGDANSDEKITVDELVTAVNQALHGCTLDAAARACLQSGGTLGSGLCCLSTGDFPDTCAVGACGCAIEDSHEVRTCNCGAGRCFNGSGCVQD